MAESSKRNDRGAVSSADAAAQKNTDAQTDKSGNAPEAVKEQTATSLGKPEDSTPAAGSDVATQAAASSDEAPVAEPSVSEPAAAEPAAATVSEPASAGEATPSRKAGFKSGSKAEESAEPKPSIKELKEKIMATNPNYTNAMTTTMTDAVAELQDRSKAAFEKSTELMAEASDFAKGTVEAIVESGKIFSGSVQDLGKTYADEAKSAYELMSADLKEMAAIKSPTELFQLQGKIMRRNFDAVVSTTSKNAEKVMKLSNDVFAPLSARMNVAAEKMSKVA